jgi:hypothetical protein
MLFVFSTDTQTRGVQSEMSYAKECGVPIEFVDETIG